MDYQFFRERVAQKKLGIKIISSNDQVADGFTKAQPVCAGYKSLDPISILQVASCVASCDCGGCIRNCDTYLESLVYLSCTRLLHEELLVSYHGYI